MIVVTGNGDLPLATQRRVESIASDRSPFAGRKSVRIASLFSLFSFAIFFDSTKRIFPDSGVPFTGFDCWLCYFRYSRGGALDRAGLRLCKRTRQRILLVQDELEGSGQRHF